jgi:hypothetical protein
VTGVLGVICIATPDLPRDLVVVSLIHGHVQAIDALDAEFQPVALAGEIAVTAESHFHRVAALDLLHGCVAEQVDLASERLDPDPPFPIERIAQGSNGGFGGLRSCAREHH